jgi:hypothetical protein
MCKLSIVSIICNSNYIECTPLNVTWVLTHGLPTYTYLICELEIFLTL